MPGRRPAYAETQCASQILGHSVVLARALVVMCATFEEVGGQGQAAHMILGWMVRAQWSPGFALG